MNGVQNSHLKDIPRESSRFTWAVVILLSAGILIKGFFAFFAVGDMGQPTWDYRPVKDVPGQSPYAVYQKLPDPQHVRGAGGE